MRASSALLSVTLVGALAGCRAVSPAPAYDCGGNSAPFIGNLTVDSVCKSMEPTVDPDTGAEDYAPCPDWANPWDPEAIVIPPDERPFRAAEDFTWFLQVRLDWADPGVQGATDAPNMLAGHVSVLVDGFEPSLFYFWPSDSQVDAVSEDEAVAIVPLDRTTTGGSLALETRLEPEGLYFGRELAMRVTAWDNCAIPSNELTLTYGLGLGQWVQDSGQQVPGDAT